MAEEIRLDVVAVGHNKGLDDTSRALRGVRAESDKTGKSFKDTSDATFDLDKAIAEAREEIHRLNEEVRKTGDRSLLGDLRRQKRDLDDFLRLAGKAQGAASASAGGALDLGGEGMRPRSALILGLVSAAAAAAPGIGAMIAGAIAGAVGTVGLAAGLASAAKDPQVQAEARAFGRAVSSEFFSGGEAFRQPAIDAIRELKSAFSDMEIPDALAKLAPLTDEIARGFANAGRDFMPGFNKALDRMGPFADVAEDGIAELGESLGDFLDRITRSEGAVTGLDLLFKTINGTINILGASLEVAGNITDAYSEAVARASGAIAGLLSGMGLQQAAGAAARWAQVWLDIGQDNVDTKLFKMGEGVTSSTDAVFHAISTWEEYTEKIRAANEAVSRSIQLALSQDNATLGLQAAMLDLQETLKENGRHWETNTEKGLANRRALLDAVGAAERKRQADIDSGISADEANRAYQRQIDKLKRMATQAGIGAKALDDLVGDYDIRLHISTTGRLPRINYTNLPEGEIFPSNRRRAAGGPMGPGAWLVGERGPEVLQMGAGARGHMYPSVGAYHGAGGRQTVHHVLDVRINGRTLRKIAIDDALGRGRSATEVSTAYP